VDGYLHGGAHGRVVQVDPMKRKLKAPGAKRLKLKYDEPLSIFAFKCILHRYTMVAGAALAELGRLRQARMGGGGGGGGAAGELSLTDLAQSLELGDCGLESRGWVGPPDIYRHAIGRHYLKRRGLILRSIMLKQMQYATS